MITTLSTKGQIVIPAEFRARKSLKAGDRLEIEETEQGIFLKKAERITPKLIEKGGLLVFRADESPSLITTEVVKQLENELV